MIKDIGFTDALQAYCHQYFLKEPFILEKLRQETEKMPQGHMQITPLQGQFLSFLVKMIQAEKILEIGTYTGYSSLVMALALPEKGQLITCDKNTEWTKTAIKYWQEAKIEQKIQLMQGLALDSLNLLSQKEELFDLILIDADKKNYEYYYEQSLQLLKPNGVIIVDNILWRGRVTEHRPEDQTWAYIQSFNKKVSLDPHVEICLIPIGDGFTLIRKKN